MQTENRYAHVDAMRAIAALCVATLHISQKLEDFAGSGQWLLQFADDWQIGAVGVALFFLVSGFVIPASLSARDGRAEGLRVFAIRRFFRLYPAYWLSIPLVLWSMWWLEGRPIDFADVLVNITMFQRMLGFSHIVNLYWTLSYELVFYILCAALFAVGLLHRPWALIAVLYGFAAIFVAVALIGPGEEGYLTFYTDMPSHLGLMFTGALLRQWHDGKPLSRWVKAALIGVIVLFVLPAARSFRFTDGQFQFHPIGGWSGAFAILFFILAVMRLKLAHPLLSGLGSISYSVYLFHTVWAFVAVWLLAQPGFEWARGWDLTAYWALILAGTIIFSAGVYNWLELPMIELGRRLTRRSGTRSTPMAVEAAAS